MSKIPARLTRNPDRLPSAIQRLLPLCALWMVAIAFSAAAQEVPYRILNTIRPGGTGGFDYVYADEAARNLYVPRLGDSGRITVFNLDTLEHVGDIPNVSAHGVAVSRKSMHGFATSKPVAMWDARTLAPIKTIDVDGLRMEFSMTHSTIASISSATKPPTRP